ncbi:MAG: AAA family ATPase [Nitrosopumilus sp.]|nr:AAA family ATPase [Nitrosopumilus sp.]MDH3394683.1 AAA family ATPase [Nitrosopumilus sp.]
MLVIVCGLPGTGKTTFAKKLAPLINSVVLSTDKIRKELITKPTYQKEERRLIYDVMMLLAKYLHDSGTNCILDATFNKEDYRIEVKKKVGLSDKQFLVIECSCPENVAISRLKERKNDYSDADIEIYQKMKKIYEPVKGRHITIDTTLDPEKNAKLAAQKLSN